MPDDLKSAMADVDAAKSQMDQSYAALKGASPAPTGPKKWNVRAPDGTMYRGVQAPTLQDAINKMKSGPQGPLAAPQRTPRGEMNTAGLPELAKTLPAAVMGPAGAAATLAMEGTGPKPPSNKRDMLGDLVPLAAAAIPGGRTATRFARTLGANVLGRGAVEGGAEALSPTGQGPLSAGVQGALKGVLPGVVQGGVGLAMGPGKGTLKVAEAAQALKKSVSPEVAKFINPKDPASLLSKRTAQKMQQAAGTNLDKMEADVEKMLGPKFRVQGTGGAGSQQPALYTASGTRIQGGLPLQGSQGQTFAEVRSEIKRLREIANYDKGAGTETAQAARKDAQKLEQTLLRQLPPDAAKRYQAGTAQHTADSDAIRWVKAQQKRNAVAGGANPIDRPGLAEAETSMNRAQGGAGKALVHGGVSLLEAAKGFLPGAGYHGARAMEGMRGAGPLRPGNPSQTLPAITRGILGLGTAQAQKPLLPPAEAQ